MNNNQAANEMQMQHNNQMAATSGGPGAMLTDLQQPPQPGPGMQAPYQPGQIQQQPNTQVPQAQPT